MKTILKGNQNKIFNKKTKFKVDKVSEVKRNNTWIPKLRICIQVLNLQKIRIKSCEKKNNFWAKTFQITIL